MQNLKEKFQRFMIGRYGADQLGRFLSIVIVILAAVSFFIRSYWFGSLIRSVLIILLAILYFRIFSRNITRRSQENNAYIRLHFQVSERLKGWRFHLEERRRYKIFSCPGCKQKIRIPRNHGKVSIRCPKCGHDFIKTQARKIDCSTGKAKTAFAGIFLLFFHKTR